MDFDAWKQQKGKPEPERDRGWRRPDRPPAPPPGAGATKSGPVPCLIGAAIGVVPLGPRDYTIGRGNEVDIQIRSELVSRVHAKLMWRGHTHKVVDNESRNGTFVNQKQVKEKDLENDDVVAFGEINLTYRLVTDVEHLKRTLCFEGETTRVAKELAPGHAHGHIAGGGLVNYAKKVAADGLSGVIKIEASGIGGHIMVRDGKAIDGRYGRTSGRSAIVRMLALQAGEYSFEERGDVTSFLAPMDLLDLVAEAAQGETGFGGLSDRLPGQ